MSLTITSTANNLIEMKILSSLLGILLSVSVVAQPVIDLVVYTTEPDPFFLILNGKAK